MFPTILIGAAMIAGACLFNALSNKEKERQQRLEENYREYRAASDEEYSQILRDRNFNLNRIRQQTAHEIWKERQRALVERKTRNLKNFDVLMTEWKGQYSDRESLLEQTKTTITEIKKAKDAQQATELRRNSFDVILNDAFEALSRQKAYLGYLNRYRKSAEKLFERTGELLEPFQMKLPEFWAYSGKIIGFERGNLLNGEFEKNIHPRVDCKFFCEDSAEIEKLFPEEEIIYCLVEGYDEKTYTNKISAVKGMFLRKLELSPNIQLVSKVKGHKQNEQGYITKYILDVDGIEMSLPQEYCRDRRNLSPVGSLKYVYVRNFDRKKLAWVNVTERVEDCLSVERFRNVPLLIKSSDYPNFIEVVRKRNAGNSYDEWYLAPVFDGENLSPMNYKCQLGQKLVFQANFCGEEFPILYFERFLPDEEMVAADDIFVALDASLKTYYLEESEAIPPEHLQESLNLFIYLSAEFTRQRRIKFNRENVLFLNQWCEVMRRLVKVKESGGFTSVEILEQVDERKFLTSSDGVAKLKKFYDQQVRRHDTEPNFFIRDTNDRKIFVIFEDNFKTIRAQGNLSENFLDSIGYSMDVHVSEFPYPEIMQSTSLEDFRRSQVQTPALKEFILDLSHMPFNDSGQRPRSIKNASLLRNRNQMLAVVRALAVKDFFMIQGPPGTGKTTVIKEIIWQQLKLEPESKILVVSQANVAVDNVLRGLPSMGIACESIVRCGNDEKISDELKDFSLDKQVELYRESLCAPCHPSLQNYREIWRDMMKNTETQGLVGEYMLKKFSVTGATCVGLAKKHFGLDKLSFDLVIADEAGKALPGELLLPINRAKKVVIIGDHKQLPPVIDPAFFDETKINIKDIVDEDSRDKFFATSLFEKLYEACPNENKCMLDIQFRMPTRIGELVSNLFYDGLLHCAPDCERKTSLFFNNNILFLNMDGDPNYREQQDDMDNGKSGPYNEIEIQIASALLKKLRENFAERIAVITPYKNQNKKLRQRLRAERLKNIVVNTIDAFQGDEADVVIYCTTRAVTPTKYFSDAARINVAFSRARNLLIIIGALKYFRKYKTGHLMQKIADYLERSGRIVNAEDFFAEDFQMNFVAPTLPENEKSSEHLTETLLSSCEIEKYLPEQVILESSLVSCRGCGKKFKAEELTENFCAECLFDGEHYKCQNCKTDMLYTNATQYVYHKPKEELCEDCKVIHKHRCKRCGVKEVIVRVRDLKNNPQKTPQDFPYCRECVTERNEKISIRCAACGKEFFISQGKVEDLQAQGKTPSKYCQDCWKTETVAGYCKNCRRPILFKRAKLYELKRQDKKISEYCPDCFKKRNEKISVRCKACGTEIVYTKGRVEDLRAQGKMPSEYCQDCWNKKIPVGMCKICGRTIYYSKAKLNQLNEKYGSDYSSPKRCENCK